MFLYRKKEYQKNSDMLVSVNFSASCDIDINGIKYSVKQKNDKQFYLKKKTEAEYILLVNSYIPSIRITLKENTISVECLIDIFARILLIIFTAVFLTVDIVFVFLGEYLASDISGIIWLPNLLVVINILTAKLMFEYYSKKIYAYTDKLFVHSEE